MPNLTPRAFVTADEMKVHMLRTGGAETNVDDRIAVAINDAVAWMESWTGRALKARNYRQPVTLSGITLVGSDDYATLNRSAGGFSANVKAGDDVFGVRAPFGQVVATVTNDSIIVCERSFDSDSFTGTSSLTFAAGAQIHDGSGSSDLRLREWPVKQLWGASYLSDDLSTWVALDVTAYSVDAGGLLTLRNDTFPEGRANVRIEYRAGYEQPGASGATDELAWNLLAKANRRLAEIAFQDNATPRGRFTEASLGTAVTRINDWAMPADVAALLAPYRRQW